MKNQPIAIAIPATYEDLLFLNKNRAYGAYVLRKLYKRHMIIATIITVVLFSLSISSPLILNKEVADVRIPSHGHDTMIVHLDPPPPIDPEHKQEIPEDFISSIKTVQFTVPRVVINSENIEAYVPDVKELQNATPWTKTQEGQEGGYDPTLMEIVEGSQNTTVKTEETPPAVNFVAEMPSYPGGDEAILSFFAKEIIYPEIARRAGIQGKVFLEFIVERDGSISNIKVAKGISGGCDEEAVRVLKMLGKWRPGRQNGTPARVRMTMPINFVLR